MLMATIEGFEKLDIRVGKIIEDEKGRAILITPDAKNPKLGGKLF